MTIEHFGKNNLKKLKYFKKVVDKMFQLLYNTRASLKTNKKFVGKTRSLKTEYNRWSKEKTFLRV